MIAKILVAVICTISTLAFALDPMSGRDEVMDIDSAQKRWGNEDFIAKKFKTSGSDQRAKMAADLVRDNFWVGKPASEVKKLLGPFTGYYWSHRIPAYIIEEGWAAQNKDTWQIVFMLDNQNRVAAVKIHKNCCYVENDISARAPSEK